MLRRLDDPEPAPKHDGKLDEQGNRLIRIMGDDSEEFLGKREIVIMSGDFMNGIVLNPHQCLSLLAWLEQHRDELERLAKE